MKCSPRFSTASLICFSATAASPPIALLPPGAITLAVVQPATLAAVLSDGQTERDAQLLVAGNYPEKGFSCTEQDLDDIISTFDRFHALGDDPPIKVEHVSSPLDPLGHVTKLWRSGAVLMGKIGFDPTVAPFLAKRAVSKLSVGLGRLAENNKLALAEVSLVLNPHVKSAALLSDDPPRSRTCKRSWPGWMPTRGSANSNARANSFPPWNSTRDGSWSVAAPHSLLCPMGRHNPLPTLPSRC